LIPRPLSQKGSHKCHIQIPRRRSSYIMPVPKAHNESQR
jgi:hypothetical protein